MWNKLLLAMLFLLTSCDTGLTSSYTGGVTKETLIGTTWQEINTDYDGTYLIWKFISEDCVVNAIRGVNTQYTWEVCTISGTVTTDSENQAVFKLSGGGSLGESDMKYYMFFWMLDSSGTEAIIETYATLEDVTRYIVNEKYASGANFKKITTTS